MKKFLCIIVSLILLLAFTNLSAKMEWVRILYLVEDGAISKTWEQMDFINDSVGVALVSDARYTRLDKTTDAGISWHTIYDERAEGMLNASYDLELLDNGDIIIGYQYGRLKIIRDYYSDSKKDSIILGDSIINKESYKFNIDHIKMYDTNLGIASDGVRIYYTEDCWKSFEIISTPNYQNKTLISDPWILGPDTIIYAGTGLNHSEFNSTTNRGKTWKTIQVDEEHIYYPRIFFHDNMSGFLVGNLILTNSHRAYDIIRKTTDGGNTWKFVHFGTGNGKFGGLQDADFKDRMTGMAVGRLGTILRTTDGGENWEYDESIDWDYYGPFGMYVAYCGDTPLITALDFGLWRWQDSELMGLSDTHTHNIKSYPNPFDDYVNIEFPPALYGKQAQIQILDVAGTIIEQGNFEIQQGGLVFRNEDLTPGTYFCRVITLQNVYTIKLMKK